MHHFSFGLDLVLFPFIFWYVTIRGKADAPSQPWYGSAVPKLCVALGLSLLFLDPLRHVVLDHTPEGAPIESKLAMYSDEGGLSQTGLIMRFCSIVGFVFLLAGVVSFVLGSKRTNI